MCVYVIVLVCVGVLTKWFLQLAETGLCVRVLPRCNSGSSEIAYGVTMGGGASLSLPEEP